MRPDTTSGGTDICATLMNTFILKSNKEKRIYIEDKPEFLSKLKALEKEKNLVYLIGLPS